MIDARIPDHCGWAARGHWCKAYKALLEDHQALRERAEAAEAERAEQWRQRREAEAARDTALAVSYAARRAKAAAWNDAIDAAGNLESIHGYSNAVPRHRIRALRRAAPTEGEA